MERVAWTDERLDDFARHVDVRFDQIDKRFDRLEARIDAGFRDLHAMINRQNMTLIIGLITIVAATLARGG
jgi:hypothetical protein